MTTPSPSGGVSASTTSTFDSILGAGQSAAVASGVVSTGSAKDLPVPTWHTTSFGGQPNKFGSMKVPESGVSENQLDPSSYFGGVPLKSGEVASTPEGTYSDTPKTRAAGDVYGDVLRMPQGDLDSLGAQLVSAGLLSPNYTRDDIEGVWKDLVDKAASWHQANPDSTLTPEDMIGLYSKAGGGGTVKDYVTSTTRLSDPDTARNVLTNILSTALGRAPTGQEADDFQSALNLAQTKSPTVTHQVVTTDPQGNQSSVDTTTGGVDPGNFAASYGQDNVAKTAEYAHYQAATTYYQALQRGIRAPA